jgi:ribosomal protein L11 methylase PrmA
MTDEALGASFRDPSGFVFERDGSIYRQVNRVYAEDYDRLMASGLYAELVEQKLLLAHEEVPSPLPDAGDAYRTLRPERVDFISYPYEWCFSQLKDAAFATLHVQQAALRHGMVLRDASAYNVQFLRGRPVFIDTLSFARYEEGGPWVAYRQFCQHFLAPLALVAHRDVRLLQLLRVHMDGIPLDLARALLPTRAWLNVHLLLHIRVHAGYQRRYAGDTEAGAKVRGMSKQALGNLVTALESATKKLHWKAAGTEWAEYYDGDSYETGAAEHKQTVVGAYLDEIAPSRLWDLGANTGAYSRIAAARGIETLAFDVDPACVDRNYRQVREDGETRLLPLLLDLTSPSPALGWATQERDSIVDRSSADAVMALALIHHIAISNNVPLGRIAAFLARLAGDLIIEFVPKSDPKVAVLLATREDIFPDYTETGFEAAFGAVFDIERKTRLEGSERTLYRMRRREPATSTA